MYRSIALVVSVFWASAFGIAQAQEIYKWIDENGKVHYGDAPADSQKGRATKVEAKIPVPSDNQRGAATDRAARQKQSWDERTQKEADKTAATTAADSAEPVDDFEPEVVAEGSSCEQQKRAYEEAARCFERYRSPTRVVDERAYDRCPDVKKPAGC